MLDPRIYRTGFVAVALAVVVVAFSLVDQHPPAGTTLAPDAFSGQNSTALMHSMARDYPQRRPGSFGDNDLATFLARRLRHYGYRVSTTLASARTATGRRSLRTVIGERVGLTPGSIVVLAPRDALGVPAMPELSGTATLLELARVLAGETQHHTIVLVSVSGGSGMAGATQVAKSLPRPIDAVISLGDLAAARPASPIVIPWSLGDRVAPALLRNTLGAALSAQAGLKPGGTGLIGQLSHLAFPMTLSQQAPFVDRGIPAVTLSLAGDRAPSPGEATSAQSAIAAGRALLQSVDALDAAPTVDPPQAYLLLSGKLLPLWALRVLILSLLLPVALAAVDGLARVRRRGYHPGRGMLRSLSQAVPFLLAAAVLVVAGRTGLLSAAPPGPLGPGAVPVSGGDAAVLGVAALILVGGLALARWLTPGGLGAAAGAQGPDPGHAIGTLMILCLAAGAVWVLNPFAALLAVPALHLWLWLLDPELRPHPAAVPTLLGLGLVPVVVVAWQYAHTLGLTPPEMAWNGLLLVAGGAISPTLSAAWAVMLGALCSVVAISLAALRQPRLQDAPVTVRGPVTYAGPGSLGGTESALRR